MANPPVPPPLDPNPEPEHEKHADTGESPRGSARPAPPRSGLGRHRRLPDGPALAEQRAAWRRERHQRRAAQQVRRPDGRFTRLPSVESTKAMRRLLQLKGVQALDQRTPVVQALAYWQRELIAHLGGEAAVTPPQRLLIEDAARTTIFLGHVDYYLLDQAATARSSLIRKRRRAMSQVAPLVLERMRIADHLTKVLTTLGLERRAPKPLELGGYLAETYGARAGRSRRPRRTGGPRRERRKRAGGSPPVKRGNALTSPAVGRRPGPVGYRSPLTRSVTRGKAVTGPPGDRPTRQAPAGVVTRAAGPPGSGGARRTEQPGAAAPPARASVGPPDAP